MPRLAASSLLFSCTYACAGPPILRAPEQAPEPSPAGPLHISLLPSPEDGSHVPPHLAGSLPLSLACAFACARPPIRRAPAEASEAWLAGPSRSHGSRFGGRPPRPATSGGPQLPSASPPLRPRSAAAPDAGTSQRLSEPFEDDGRGACPCHIGVPEVNGMSAFYCMFAPLGLVFYFFFFGSSPIQASETLVCGAASRFPTQADPIFLLFFIRVRALCSCRSHACREAASLDRALQPVWRLPPEYYVLRLLPCLRLPRPSPKPGLPCSLFLYGLAVPANLQFCVFSRQGSLTSASLSRAL